MRNKLNISASIRDSDNYPGLRTPVRFRRDGIRRQREQSLSDSDDESKKDGESVSFSACYFSPEEDSPNRPKQVNRLQNARDNAFGRPA